MEVWLPLYAFMSLTEKNLLNDSSAEGVGVGRV